MSVNAGERKVVRLAGFEPTTPGSASQCSNPLSYKRIKNLPAVSPYPIGAVRITGAREALIVPAKSGLLPVSYMVPRVGFEPTHP